MPGVVNPENINFKHDGLNTDGTPFDPTKFGGWQLDLNGRPSVSVPLGWETDGTYAAPVAALKLPEGDYVASIRLVTKDGTSSAPSATDDFKIRKVPSRPLAFSVA